MADNPTGLAELLVELHRSFTAIEANDLTERYAYAGDGSSGPRRNRRGEVPGKPGERWFTPREIAALAKRRIEGVVEVPGDE